jgi:long-subunit fatty acid transport protein
VSIGVSAAMGDMLFLGLGVNFGSIRYEQSFYNWEVVTPATGSSYRQKYYPDKDTSISPQATYNYSTRGQGIGLSAGLIFKTPQNIRLGISIESPTWYTKMSDDYTQYTSSTSRDVRYNYEYTSPWRVNAGFAMVLEEKAIVSVDYTLIDHTSASFGPNGDHKVLNDNISSNSNSKLKASSEVRAGLEFKPTDMFSVRGGFRWSESPYKNSTTTSGTDIYSDVLAYSGGLGFVMGNAQIDLSYVYSKLNREQIIYPNFTRYGQIANTSHNVALGVTFHF